MSFSSLILFNLVILVILVILVCFNLVILVVGSPDYLLAFEDVEKTRVFTSVLLE